MEWIQVLVIIAAQYGVFLWIRTEANADRRDSTRMILDMQSEFRHEMNEFRQEIRQEMKDFHGRLERQDADFKAHLKYHHSIKE